MVRKVLIGAALLVVMTAAPAAAQYNPIVVQPGQVEAGQTVTVTGEACEPFEHVVITVRHYDPAADPNRATKATDPGPVGTGDPILTVEVDADADGKFSVTFQIPPGTEPGTYVIESDSACVQSALIDVVPPTPTTPGTGGGSLPRTGSDIDKLGMAGAGLLVLGGLVLVATKRRRHEASPTPA